MLKQEVLRYSIRREYIIASFSNKHMSNITSELRSTAVHIFSTYRNGCV